ncbi:Tll0287-like domain-containing protein [Calothrix sp. NIES-3974]|uniref:Tll0287-like domain-containing protein n=1 Tax=Calothrix sp. NIES-3974 TaxID=2005462 RepID=UPI000B5DBDAC|nr:DUF3365 domain-containing protein [Calothrix sp. NIES-3974]BAZ04505.1 sensor protein [Calothrix sp. NIES-3974]
MLSRIDFRKLTQFKLASQFTLSLLLIFIIGIGLGGLALSSALEQKAEAEIVYRGHLAMHLVTAVRNYTLNQIGPRIYELANMENGFIPETVPSIAAKTVFTKLRENQEYQNLAYREATLNPTNPEDQANLFEARLIQRFQSDRTLKSLSDFRTEVDQKQFYIAQPLVVTSESCLRCHSTPEQAPKSLIEKYGTRNGFGWEVNQVIGAQVIYVPANEVFMNARKALFLFISIFSVIFALVLGAINYLLKRRVIQPLKPMAKLAQTISQENVSAKEVRAIERQGLHAIAKREDELGHLGKILQKMVREIYHREQILSEQLQQLRFEIDQKQRENQVKEIAESDYFQNLQKTAKQIRNQPDPET